MGKKLLFLSLFLFAYLLPTSGMAQCPSSVSISANPGTTICSSTSVTFTATPTGGTNLEYEWFIGTTSQSATGNSFTPTSLSNSDKIKVVVTSTSDASCSTTSNTLTMTVNPVLTPSVSISASKTTICPNENITFTASPINGGTNPTYVWKIGSTVQSGNSNSFSTTNLTDGQSVTVELTSNATCASPITENSSPINITVKAETPVIPGSISGLAEVCPGISSLTYSIASVANATSYEWTLPSGWSGTSTSNSITANSGSTGSGSITVKAKNDCGTSAAQSFDVEVLDRTPNTPGTITGDAQVCPGLSKTYSIATVSGATEYEWTLPSGWNGSSTTNSIDVTTGSSGSGNISVKAKNSCGISAAKTLIVSVKPGTPEQPGTITGSASVCPGVQQTYTISAVTGATSYVWTLPNSGWTGTSTTNSITVTSGIAGGDIKVKAINDCGIGTERVLALTVKPGTPATPEAFSAGPVEVCPGLNATYTVPVVTGAAQYIWTIPTGFTASSLTTTTPSLTVTAGTSGSGNITVKATNDCGTSSTRSMAISIGKPVPVISGSITGPAKVCSTATGLVYSIPAITNATEYIWTVPTGWNITAGGTTRSITVSAGATSPSNNTISVSAKNSCGTSSSIAFTVTASNNVPAQPGNITTNLTTSVICPPINNITFSVPAVSGLTYNWILPAGFQIVSGAGTASITVNITGTAAYGNNIKVEVEAINACGPSAGKASYNNINLDKFVVANLGEDKTFCSSTPILNLTGYIAFGNNNSKLKLTSITSTGTNTVQDLPNGNVNDFTYTYTPSSTDLANGSVTFTLTTEKPAGSCAAGTDQMTVFFKPLPTATITATSPVCSGNTSSLTFTGTPNSRVTYRLPNNTTQTIDIPAAGTINVTTPVLTANSTYTLVSSVNLDTPPCSNTLTGSTTVVVTPKPTAAITYVGTPFCNSVTTGQNPTLTGTNAFAGGTYSSTTGLTINSSTGTITPSSSTSGTYTVTYSTLAGGGCAPVTTTTQVTITNAPTAAISYAGTPFCTSESTAKPVTLTGTDGFSGGTFTAPPGLTINSSTGAITASTSLADTYTVTYNTPAAGGCSPVTAVTQVTITKAPTVTISYPQAPFCLSDTSLKPVTITGTDAFSGGTYSALAALSINSSTGEINPSASTVGTHTVTYTSPTTSGCGAVTATTEITITQTPAAEISYADPFCNNDEALKAVTFNNTAGAYTGGTFSIGGGESGLNINISTGEINAKTSSPGSYTVIYTIPEGNGCPTSEISTQVTITETPDVDISYNTPLCTSDTAAYPVTFTNGFGAYQGGTFTGTSGLSIDANGNIIPANSTPGVHTITYTTIAAEGCGTFQTTTEVEIFKEVVITTEPVNVGICSTEPASFEVVASGDNLTYQWKRTYGEAITNATGINTSKLSFSNATAVNAGEYFVEVSGSSPCSMAVSEPVTLNIDENIVIITPTKDEEFCQQDRTEITFLFEAHAKKAPLTFTWIKDGVDIPNSNTERFKFNLTGPVGEDGLYSGTFQILNPNPSDNGIYSVRIKGPDYFTCSDAETKTFTLNVNPLPDQPGTTDIVYCQNAEASPLTATGESGAEFTWYDENMVALDGAPTPSTSEAGTFTYYVTQTTEVCESNPSELIVTIKPTPLTPTTNQSVTYCFNDVITEPLTATKNDSNSTLNWYGPDDKNAALTSAPTPVTSTTGTFKYWVSEIFDGCESPLVEIVVTINSLPVITVTADETVICEGSSTSLRATGGTSYEWFIGESSVGSGVDFIVSPIETTTYTLIGKNENACENSAQITIEVDLPTAPGTLTGPESVCASSPNGTLTLSDYTGDVQRWERSNDAGANWTEIATTSATYEFTGLTTSTSFRAIVKSGVCDALPSNQVDVDIDPLPVGGELNFAGVGRLFMICENADPGYAVNLNLTGIIGKVTAWQYRASSETSWSTIPNHTGLSLSDNQIEALNISETTVFQVIISSGTCTQNAYSKTAILSVIPTDIAPSPVTVDPGVVCIGEPVTLNSETGYTQGSVISEGGDFDNAGIISDGWGFYNKKDPSDTGFDTDANNIQPDRWKRATPHEFTTANLSGPNYPTSLKTWGSGIQDGNKGFAIVSSNNEATMETPVFSIGSTDQAILTFDQAYNLTPGSSIMVEISTDGGNNYNTVLYSLSPSQADLGITSGHLADFGLGTKQDRPENKIEVDLGNYLGSNNLRIRFSYIGTRDGDVWAVDNIKIPEGPKGIVMEWNDYTDPLDPFFIGNNNSEQYIPKLIGLNTFEVKTKLVFDSEGNACEVAENAETITVFVFDTYTSTATATGGVCGDSNIILNGKISGVNQGVITKFPTLDGYETGVWEVVGPSGYTFSEAHFTSLNEISPAIKDPKAIFNPGVSGNYTLTWTMVSTSKDDAGNLITNSGCPPVYIPVTFEIEDCTTLDFDGFDDYVDLGTSYAGNNSVEAWIRPEATTGTIFSTPNFEITMSDLLGTVSTNGRWYHIAVSNGILYVDGIEIGATGTGKGGSKTLIGARWNDTNGGAEKYFSGWIEEVRIWNKTITQAQIQFMMNQHLQNAANMGVEIPMPVPGGLAYSDLAGYYRLISKVPDPLNLETFPASLLPLNGYSPDLALNTVPARLVNMTTNQENTAPLPYISANDGDWSTPSTWLRPDVWDAPNSVGVKASVRIDWNIVRTNHDIDSGDRDITVLGLKSETQNRLLEISGPGTKNEYNPGQKLRVTHYLLLDGNIDLVGESQLLQDQGSILAESSKGYLERDQQGTLSSFNYNYWTSPVSLQGAGNNSGFTVGGIMWDGTDSNNPKVINYRPDHAAADGAKTNPITKSNYWLFKFDNRLADDYDSWQHIGSTGFLKTGEGHTMKGVSGVGGVAAIDQEQNYVYRGKPNNGDITLTIDKERNYLVGNPYPSAIDADKFILDNLNTATVNGGTNDKNIFDGTIYFWDHFSGATHILREYIGGYATLNLIGGAPAISTDYRVLANNDKGSKTPEQFIPVSQGFFVNTGTSESTSGGIDFDLDGGPITFKNSQRVFSRESSGNSVFLKPENVSKTSKEEAKKSIPKIRVSFKSPKGYQRQLLVGAHPSTTNGYDLGYDAHMIEYNVEDMYWLQGNNWLVIQGVPDFGKDQILPLGVRIEKAGEFTIKIDTLENVGASQNVYLRDILLDTIHDIKSDPYIVSAEPGEITDRFELIFYKESQQDPVIEDPEIIDDLTDISLLHSYSQNEMMVLNPQELRISAIYLFDLNGKLLDVFDEVPSEKEIRLKVANYSEGIYVLKMHTDDQIITRKIIIKK